ncbi:hypothetical protein [Streptomyces mirabilis]|uniref:hypothetical protein n=1 Tax=Streptomyces mirabilis TaxID=68239 RepID=UPI0036597085
MPDSLVIDNIDFGDVDPEQMTPAMRRSNVRWHTLTISVSNPSATTPFYVIAEPRRIRYDENQRALIIQFSEHDAPPPSTPGPLGVPLPPKHIVVRPGEQSWLTYRLSSPITFLEQTAEGGERQRLVRIPEDVDRIEFTVAYDTDAPPQEIDLTTRGGSGGWENWGKTARQSCVPPRRNGTEASD